MKQAMDAYVRRFGTGPLNMGGQLAWANLANFQAEFAKIRAAEPSLAEGVVAERAVKAISFGKHRIAMGYGDISVRYGNMGDVTVTDRSGRDDRPCATCRATSRSTPARRRPG
jgi:hypothetical protein